MSDHELSTPDPVVFRRTLPSRVGLFLKVLVSYVVLGAVAAMAVWGAIGLGVFNGNVPVWVHILGAGVLLGLPVILWALCNLSEPTQLILHEEVLLIGGALLKRTIRY